MGEINRRGFLAAAPLASLVLDPERALWVPGKKLISIPRGQTIRVRVPARFVARDGQSYQPEPISLIEWVEMTRDEFARRYPRGTLYRTG